MLPILLTLLALIGAVLAILGQVRGRRRLVYVFKPATTLLILLLAWQGGRALPPAYRPAILVGLAFSLAGDIFLMLPGDRFLAGLVSFLLAHVAYLVAFTTGHGWQAQWPILLLLALYGGLVLRLLWPHLGRMKGPAAVYMVAILAMAWQALARWAQAGPEGALLAAAGALFFLISDSVLALDRFRRPFAAAQPLILATYYLAQWLIALSV